MDKNKLRKAYDKAEEAQKLLNEAFSGYAAGVRADKTGLACKAENGLIDAKDAIMDLVENTP